MCKWIKVLGIVTVMLQCRAETIGDVLKQYYQAKGTSSEIVVLSKLSAVADNAVGSIRTELQNLFNNNDIRQGITQKITQLASQQQPGQPAQPAPVRREQATPIPVSPTPGGTPPPPPPPPPPPLPPAPKPSSTTVIIPPSSFVPDESQQTDTPTEPKIAAGKKPITIKPPTKDEEKNFMQLSLPRKIEIIIYTLAVNPTPPSSINIQEHAYALMQKNPAQQIATDDLSTKKVLKILLPKLKEQDNWDLLVKEFEEAGLKSYRALRSTQS